jgi:fucose 4-O-acetylase-like acetyltransferase
VEPGAPAGFGDDFLHWLPIFIHTFRMPLFFMMAGLFGAMLLARGTRRFVANRAERIALPLTVGILVLVPIVDITRDWYAFRPIEPAIPGPEHLWFLEYLLIFYLGALLLRRLPLPAALRDRSAWVDRFFTAPLLLPRLMAVTLATVVVTGGWGVNPANTFVPDVSQVAFYGVFFALGWALWTRRDHFQRLEPHAAWHGLLALALSIPLVEAFDRSLAAQSGWISGPELIYFALSCVVGWLAIAALYAIAVRVFNRPRPRVRYFVDASYWIYLVHVPLLFLLNRPLQSFGLDGVTGFVVACLVVTAVALATYAVGVRHTAIGRVLHGPRPRSRPTSRPPVEEPAVARA